MSKNATGTLEQIMDADERPFEIMKFHQKNKEYDIESYKAEQEY